MSPDLYPQRRVNFGDNTKYSFFWVIIRAVFGIFDRSYFISTTPNSFVSPLFLSSLNHVLQRYVRAIPLPAFLKFTTAIREYDAKLLLAYWLQRAPPVAPNAEVKTNFKYPSVKVAQISWDPETNSITPDSKLPGWVFNTKLVAKPDQLIKRRGKAGLLALNKTWDEAKAWIAQRAGRPQKVSRSSYFCFVFMAAYTMKNGYQDFNLRLQIFVHVTDESPGRKRHREVEQLHRRTLPSPSIQHRVLCLYQLPARRRPHTFYP